MSACSNGPAKKKKRERKIPPPPSTNPTQTPIYKTDLEDRAADFCIFSLMRQYE